MNCVISRVAWNVFLSKLMRLQSLSGKDAIFIRAHTQELLSDFIANLTVRNPCMVSQNRQRTQQIVDEIFSEPIDPILEGIMSLYPNFKESTLLEYVCKQICFKSYHL